MLKKSARARCEHDYSVVVKENTQRFGSPNTFIPFTFLKLFATSCVAEIISLAFYLKPFIVIWVKEYQAAALAKPDLEPAKVGVPYRPPFHYEFT